MSSQNSKSRTRIMLSFSSAYSDLALRLANDLRTANILVVLDQWEGGGGAPAFQSVPRGVADAAFVLPLLTPSDAARTWVGEEWRQAIYCEAQGRGIDVLPVRGDGDLDAVPDFLRDFSFADLQSCGYSLELRRLVETIRDKSGDAKIEIPTSDGDGRTTCSPLTPPAHPLVLEVSEELLPLFKGNLRTNSFIDVMVPMMCDGLFYELGVQFPGLCLRVGYDLPPSFARIVINDVPETQLEVRPASVMVNESVSAMAERGFDAEPAVNPATGAPFAWIPDHKATAAMNCGLTTWDAPGFLILSLSSILRRKAADFIEIGYVRAMLEQIEPVFPQLVAETVPKTVSLFVLTDVLRRLVTEGVSIRNLRQILMALANWGCVENDPLFLTEYARAALQRLITHRLSRGSNKLVVFLLDPDIETSIRDSTRHTATGSYVDLEPDHLRNILDAIRMPLDALPDGVQVPQILTVMEIRSSIRRLVAPSMPMLNIVSYQELAPDTNIQPIGRISLDGFSPRAGVSVGRVPLWG